MRGGCLLSRVAGVALFVDVFMCRLVALYLSPFVVRETVTAADLFLTSYGVSMGRGIGCRYAF